MLETALRARTGSARRGRALAPPWERRELAWRAQAIREEPDKDGIAANRRTFGHVSQWYTINTNMNATVAYPTIKRLLIHMFYDVNLRKLLK